MENKVSYIVDEFGKKTHAIIPMDEWRKYLASKKDDNNSKNSMIDVVEEIYSGVIPAVLEGLGLMSSIEDENFLDKLRATYQFVEVASCSDIALLYLIRNIEFNNLILHDDISGDALVEYVYKEYYITDLQGQKLSLKQIDEMREIFLSNFHTKSLLKEFNKHYKLGDGTFKKRIRRDAEIKRLFLFDILTNLVRIMPDFSEDKDRVDELTTSIAKALYPDSEIKNAMTQANKTLREVKERTFNDGWKIYIGK